MIIQPQRPHFYHSSIHLNESDYLPLIRWALEEDQAYHDVTTKALFPSAKKASGNIIAQEAGILAGGKIACSTFKQLDPSLKLQAFCEDGERFIEGRRILSMQGDIRAILSGERVALNFLSFMSGISTLSRHISDKLSKWGIKLTDTRKTIPGLRIPSKYAVHMGRGVNQRLNLAGQGLLKDNHFAGYKHIRNALVIFKSSYPDLICQAEVENPQQLQGALLGQPDGILLDNMTPRQIKKCVREIKKYSKARQKKIIIEASGGYNLKNIRSLKNTGIDYVSMSSITMASKPINFNLEID